MTEVRSAGGRWQGDPVRPPRYSWPLRLAVALACGLALAGCGGASGRIKGALPDARFVKSTQRLYFNSTREKKWLVAGLDGTVHRRLFRNDYGISDISADGRVFVLRNSNTDMFIATFDGAGAPAIREVKAFHGLQDDSAVSPDGRFVVAAKHGNFDLPQKQWVDDPAIYLIDTRSLAIRAVATYPIKAKVLSLRFVWLDNRKIRVTGRDGPLLGGREASVLTIDLRSGRTTAHAPDQAEKLLNDSRRWKDARAREAKCGMKTRARGRMGDQGIDLSGRDGAWRRLVIVEGRTRGYHDIIATISGEEFSRDCRYVLFGFKGGLWIVEIVTGKVGPILPGRSWAFRHWYPIGLD